MYNFLLHRIADYVRLVYRNLLEVLYASYSTGDIFIACLTKQESVLKLTPAGASPGSDPVTVPVVTRIEFALTPLSEEDVEADAAIRSWEGVYHSVSEFFEARLDQSMPMPAVSVYGLATCTISA